MTWKGDDDVQGLLLFLLHRHHTYTTYINKYATVLCSLIWILIMSFNFHIFHHFWYKTESSKESICNQDCVAQFFCLQKSFNCNVIVMQHLFSSIKCKIFCRLYQHLYHQSIQEFWRHDRSNYNKWIIWSSPQRKQNPFKDHLYKSNLFSSTTCPFKST